MSDFSFKDFINILLKYSFLFLFLGLIFFVLTWFDIEKKISNYMKQTPLDAKAQLIVKTENSTSKVFLNDKQIGKTTLELANLQPQKTNILLVRDNNPNNFYTNLEIPIVLTAKSKTVVQAEIGPSLNTSWYIVSYVDSQKVSNSQIFITSIPDKSQVFINNDYKGVTPLILDNVQYTNNILDLKLTKAGYKYLLTQINFIQNKKVVVESKLYKIVF